MARIRIGLGGYFQDPSWNILLSGKLLAGKTIHRGVRLNCVFSIDLNTLVDKPVGDRIVSVCMFVLR